MASKLFILSLLGLVCLQAVQSQIAAPSALPITTISSSIFYDSYGYSLLSTTYPYYDFYGYRMPTCLVNDYGKYQQLAIYSALYNVPLSDLYQMNSIIDANMPRLPTDLDLNMLQGLAQAIQEEKIRDYTNPYLSALSPNDPAALTWAQLNGYLPADFPVSYRYMYSYLNYLIPGLSADALLDIQNTVYNNTPASMISQADDLTFQLQTAIRYMLASQMYYIPKY